MTILDVAKYIIEKKPNSNMAEYVQYVEEIEKESSMTKQPMLDIYKHELIEGCMDFFDTHIGICGCGAPEETYLILRNLLTIRKKWAEESQKSTGIHDDRAFNNCQKRYKEQLHLDTEDVTEDGILQFMLYILDHKEIVEHGSSIGGCWLTELGKMYLVTLNEWYDEEYGDDKESNTSSN